MRDFTLKAFNLLLTSLKSYGYTFITFEDYLLKKPTNKKYIILRHDVDLLAKNSLATAIIEHQLGIKGVYYFRIVRASNKPPIIKAIADLGHEIGYHYEDMALCNGDTSKAIALFEKNLTYFRQFYPIKTICMHGSPMSRWDNRKIWEQYDYRNYGIIGEPYFDIDFNTFFYLTDTGRTWDGDKISVRDKVNSNTNTNLKFKTTFNIIDSIPLLPDLIMITTHPQRWNNSIIRWTLEYASQNTKNLFKRLISSK